MKKNMNHKNYIDSGYPAMENKKFVIGEDIEGNEVRLEKDELQKRLAAYGLLINENKILLVKSIYGNTFSLPGGGVGNKEGIKKALIREFKEETGLNIKPTKLVYSQDRFFKAPRGEKFHTINYYYIVKYINGELEIKDEKIKSAEWINLENLENAALNASISFLPELLRN